MSSDDVSYVPANEGFNVLSYFVDKAGKETVTRHPVLAWQISNGGDDVNPVTLCGVDSINVIRYPGGKIMGGLGTGEYYRDDEAWLEMARTREQDERELSD